jgi:hypothetical protein
MKWNAWATPALKHLLIPVNLNNAHWCLVIVTLKRLRLSVGSHCLDLTRATVSKRGGAGSPVHATYEARNTAIRYRAPFDVNYGGDIRNCWYWWMCFVCIAHSYYTVGVYGDGDYSGKTAYLYLVIVNNVSFTWALYCLVAFYFGTKMELSPYRPLLKFITIKVAVFFSFWQSIFIAILCAVGAIQGFWLYTATQAGIVLNAVLICVEMAGISVAQLSFSLLMT